MNGFRRSGTSGRRRLLPRDGVVLLPQRPKAPLPMRSHSSTATVVFPRRVPAASVESNQQQRRFSASFPAANAADAQTLLSVPEAKARTQAMEDPEFHIAGSLSDFGWQEMAHLIKSWSQHKTEESVGLSFALLERLLVEQEVLMQNPSVLAATNPGENQPVAQPLMMSDEERREKQMLSRELLNTGLLNEVVNNWRNAWKTQNTKISPRRILPQLEGYIDRSPSLHPDTKTYNMVMDAVTKRFSKKTAEQLAGEIFHRMTNTTPHSLSDPSFQWTPTPTINGKLRCLNDISPDGYTYSTIIKVYTYSQNPKAAEEILSRLHKDYIDGKSTLQPNARMFTACINAWAHSQAPDAPEKAESLVRVMQLLDEEQELDDIKPTVFTLNALLNCWAKCGRPDVGEYAERILREMPTVYGVTPDLVSYKTVLHLVTNVAPNVEIAEAVFHRMQSSSYPRYIDHETYQLMLRALHENASKIHNVAEKVEWYLKRMIEEGIQPKTTTIYNHVLGALAHSKSPQAGGRAYRIFKHMREPPEGRNIKPTQPNKLTYKYVMMALASTGQAKLAEQVFWRMFGDYRRGNKKAKPTRTTLNLVVSAWAATTKISDEERVKSILSLLRRVVSLNENAVQPDVTTANTFLHCLSKLSSDEARFQAERCLDELEKDWKASKDESVKPDIISYSSVMKAHANVGDINRTREVLHRCIEEYRNGNETAKPDIRAFNHVLLAIARGARGRNLGAGKLADDVFQQIHEYHQAGIIDELPDKTSYDITMSCWANSGSKHAGEEAEKILHTMEEMASKGRPKLEPDTVSYSTALMAHAKNADVKKAEDLLKKMLVGYGEGNEKLKPNLQTINTFLSAVAQSREPDAGEKAESYLREMLEANDVLSVKPDVVTFSIVITAWANSGDPRAAERAKSIYREIELLSLKQECDLKLDNGFYQSMLRAFAVTGDVEAAESLLEMIRHTDEASIRPDRYMFQAVLQAYTRSNQGLDHADNADALLQEMKGRSVENGALYPDRECYHCVLECWANSKDLSKAAERSEALLLEMARNLRANTKPTPLTYSRVLNTMARAGDTERTKALLRCMYQKPGMESTLGAALPM
ncbi:Pentatricopeptide repeat-containing protein [Seminavis robusta]|uniref:Pentatricopeptide repeat-containing protein n=1 Tax=Seminavis robusta TaxID=568900 RepID=A0A9N8ER90_9STRA|nr:Pentatricopeptide repeat-containing protein [Seminavis robusta]|eukprot:Sro1728_g293980.1 Pentatricopeptide repeat-containing protein (1099) ;mRNA; f:14512-17906